MLFDNPYEEDGNMGTNDKLDEIDPALLRKLFLGFIAYELKSRTIPHVKRAFVAAITESKIERNPKLNAFISHLIHDASEICIEADDKGGDADSTAVRELARLLGRANPSSK